jgi:GR25 family glycosyltransferase involved in LPS biosynthesis
MRIKLDAIYVLSLKRAADRRANIAAQFKRLSSPPKYEVVDAVDGWALDLRRWPADIGGEGKVFATHEKRQGIIGCALSYIAALRLIAERGYSWAMVLEDDFEFCRPDRSVTELEAADGADVVALDTRMNRRGVGMAGTILSRRAVREMLEILPLPEPYDTWLAKNCYGTIGGKRFEPDAKRRMFMDTTSYDDRNKFIRGAPVCEQSYLQGHR